MYISTHRLEGAFHLQLLSFYKEVICNIRTIRMSFGVNIARSQMIPKWKKFFRTSERSSIEEISYGL